MRRGWTLITLASLVLGSLGLWACAPAEEQEDPATAAAAADLAWLQENKPMLDAKRQEIQEIRDRLAGKMPEDEMMAEGEEGAEPPPTPEELEGRATALEDEIVSLSDELAQRAVSYLNTTGIIVGQELTPEQAMVVDMKVDEDILIAKDYIDKGGDYQKALDIYNNTKQLAPSNEKLLAAIAEAESLRYMTEERFAQAKKGMTQDEVRDLLGQVKHTNVREFAEQNAIGWFYRKEDGGAAGVYFREKKKGSGNWTVYNTDYNAIERQVEGGEEG